MDWEMFNELPASIDAEVAALPKDSKLVLDGQDVPAVTIAPVKMLNAESAQQLTVTVAKWLNGNGEVTFTAAPKVGSTETFVNISGKVTFNGLPAFPYEIKNEGAKVGDNYEISFEKVNETFFDKQYFADKAAVATFLKNLTLDYSGVNVAGNDKVTPIVLPAEITLVDGATLKLAFDDANINWEKQPSYTYTVPTGTGQGQHRQRQQGIRNQADRFLHPDQRNLLAQGQRFVPQARSRRQESVHRTECRCQRQRCCPERYRPQACIRYDRRG